MAVACSCRIKTSILTSFYSDMSSQINQFLPESSFEIMDFIKSEYECDSTERKLFPFDPISSLEDYPGVYNFNIRLSQPEQGRSSSFYSSVLGQVFIDMNKVLLVHFELNRIASGFYVRAMPVYAASEYYATPVNRCTVHAVESDPKGNAHADGICHCSDYDNVGHVVRTHSKDAQYCYDDVSGRHSVVVPVKRLQAGSQSFAIAYYFACKTSCPKGMQRRPIHVVFTLETTFGDVVGRKILGVRICSCPKRDKERLERDYNRRKKFLEPGSSKMTSGRKRKGSSAVEKFSSEMRELDKLLLAVGKRLNNLSNCAEEL